MIEKNLEILERTKYVSGVPILRDDRVFKRLFKNNVKRLAYLINGITGSDYKESDIFFADSEVGVDKLYCKDSRLDIFVKTKSGEYINIEMQNVFSTDFIYRMSYYTALLLGRQVKKGRGGYICNKVILICMINQKKCIYNKSLINFQKYDRIGIEKSKKKELLKDEVLVDEFIVNLAYLDSDDRLNSDAKSFLELFNAKNVKELGKMCDDKKEFKDILDDVVYITEDERFMIDGIMKEKDERDAAARIFYAKEEGIEQGSKETRNTMILNLFKKNVDLELISEASGASLDEINEIINNSK